MMAATESRERTCDTMAETLRTWLPAAAIDVSVGMTEQTPVYEIIITDPEPLDDDLTIAACRALLRGTFCSTLDLIVRVVHPQEVTP
jgi:hypothetical protein